MTDVLMKMENLDTETGTSCGFEGEISVMHLQVKGCQSLVENNQKLGKRHGTHFPSHPSEGTSPSEILISGFQILELWNNTYTLVTQSCPTLWNLMDCIPPGSHPWNSPGKNTGVVCHFLFQGIFLTQGSNPGLLNCRQILYHLSHCLLSEPPVCGVFLQ